MRCLCKLSCGFVLLTLAGSLGCEDDLPKASLITHMRVLGARTEVVGDEQRSTPRPGEQTLLTWTIAYPEYRPSDDELKSLFLVCTAPSRFSGTPVCQELIDAAQGGGSPIAATLAAGGSYSCEGRSSEPVRFGGISAACLEGTPRLPVAIEAGFEPGAKLVQGIICRNGTPQLDLGSAVGASCAPDSDADEDELDAIPVYGTVPVAHQASDENRNPDLTRIELRLRVEDSDDTRGEPWSPVPQDALPELEEDCTDSDAIPTRDANRELISLTYRDEPDQSRADRDEELVFSSFATYGELSRRFTVLTREDRERDAPPDENDEIEWTLSKEERDELAGSSKLVRFYFTVLDGRGGFDVTTRELCVSRP